jgi:pyruvate/2-oxoglutarate dehydrogenase complex dihydrolipoamide acyltransferase (E2) component
MSLSTELQVIPENRNERKVNAPSAPEATTPHPEVSVPAKTGRLLFAEDVPPYQCVREGPRGNIEKKDVKKMRSKPVCV